MKRILQTILATAAMIAPVRYCLAQLMPPEAAINITVSPATVNVGQTFTVTCRLAAYRGAAEIDGYAFAVPYDVTALVPVPNSFYLGAESGPDQQFLSKANQESIADGYMLANQCSTAHPGFVYVTVCDRARRNDEERGSRATNGFLVSFQMTALKNGSWQFSGTPYIDNSVLYDTAFRPVGTVGFNSATLIVPNPTGVLVQAADSSASEPGGDTGLFLFTRTGPTNTTTKVNFQVSGSANPTSDFAPFGTTVSIPVGASNASIVVTAVDDSEIEGDETVTITLTPSTKYDILGSGTATVIIHDDENMPPAVALTGPAHGTIFPNPTNITLTASASDPNGSVTNVEFFREGTIKLGTDSSSPYSFVWSNAPPGTYVLTARATDNLGATADSTPLSITVRGPPGVTVSCPTNFAASSSVMVTATATDPDGVPAFLELYRDGKVFGATNGSALAVLWTNAVPGTYTLTARAGDDRGLLTTSAPVVVTVTPAGLTDNYAARYFISGFTNYSTANTTYYTKEPGETNHATHWGEHSGWIAWTAPASASVTMDTFHVPYYDGFDTVLAVYTNVPGTDNVSNLLVVTYNDDAGYVNGSYTVQSRVTFTAVAGKTYAVVVDSYAPFGGSGGHGGSVQLHISQTNPAPVITASPQSQVVSVGDNATFSVTASGATPLTNQWRWNGANLSGATASSLTRTNVALTNAGLYDVIVSNSGGAVTSAPAVLVVRAPAEFTTLPSTQVVNPGGTATFAVGATGSDPLNYQWSFNGVLLPGEITNSFTRYNAQYADGGTYQITVANAAGSSGAGAELIVRPLFTSLTPSNGTLHLVWYGTTGKVYVVEGSTNVTAPSTNWTVLGSVTNTELQGQFQVSLTNPPARVLRLRVGP